MGLSCRVAPNGDEEIRYSEVTTSPKRRRKPWLDVHQPTSAPVLTPDECLPLLWQPCATRMAVIARPDTERSVPCAMISRFEVRASLAPEPETRSLIWPCPTGKNPYDLLLDAGAGNAHRPASRRAQYRPRGGGSSRWRGSPCGGSDVTIRCAILPTRSCIGRPTGLPVSSHTSLSPGVTGCSRCSAASRNSTCPLSAR